MYLLPLEVSLDFCISTAGKELNSKQIIADCQMCLTLTVSLLTSLVEELVSGCIAIRPLRLILKHQEAFVDNAEGIRPWSHDLPREEVLRDLLNNRMNELARLDMQKKHAENLLGICRAITTGRMVIYESTIMCTILSLYSTRPWTHSHWVGLFCLCYPPALRGKQFLLEYRLQCSNSLEVREGGERVTLASCTKTIISLLIYKIS